MQEITPLISVIIPVYNAEAYLAQALDSIVGQTFQRLEILCIDDGSTDSSPHILECYAQQDDRFRIVRQENAGCAEARNVGLALCRGQYVSFVDADDWIDPEFYSLLYQTALNNQAEAVMCGYTKEFADHSTPVQIFKGDRLLKGKSAVRQVLHRRLYGPIGEETARPQDLDLPASSCMQIFSTALAKNCTFPSERVTGTFEDGLFQIAFYKDCSCFAYLDRPMYHYRKTNAGSITSSHKPLLFDQWQTLFDRLEQDISDFGYGESYRLALQNRILFSLIGLGLNEIYASGSIFSKAGALRKILQSERYQNAFAALDVHYIPFAWRIFFFLCRKKRTLLLTLLLQAIEFLRKRVR